MKKLFYFSTLLIFFLSACGTSATPTPTAVPPTSIPPTAILTPTEVPATPAVAPTAAATATTATSSECTDAAVFVDDVTIPDYSHMDPRETFTKTWRIKNTLSRRTDG